MGEEMIDLEVNLGKELADKINKMTKKELLGVVVSTSLKTKIQEETISNLESDIRKNDKEHVLEFRRLRKEKEETERKLDIAQSYVEQGRAMICSMMERWYEYD